MLKQRYCFLSKNEKSFFVEKDFVDFVVGKGFEPLSYNRKVIYPRFTFEGKTSIRRTDQIFGLTHYEVF